MTTELASYGEEAVSAFLVVVILCFVGAYASTAFMLSARGRRAAWSHMPVLGFIVAGVASALLAV